MSEATLRAETTTEQARFEELRFYQLALALLKAAYRLVEQLPQHEKYNMSSQLCRAALSTLLNIAEGYGRYHFPDRLRFFYYARGSLFETLSGFICAHTVGYIDDAQLAWTRQITAEAGAALNAYINYIRSGKQGAQTFGEKYIHEPNVLYAVDSVPEPTQFPDSPIPQFPDFQKDT